MVVFLLNKKNRIGFQLKREIIINVFFIYILCVISVTLFPLFITFGRNNNGISVNLIPIVGTVKEISSIPSDASMHIFMIKFWVKEIGGNMLLLFPLGAMLPMLWEKFRSCTKTVFFAFCLSLSIETMQLLSGYLGNIGRAFDIDDVLLNTLGALLGFLLYSKVINRRRVLK